MLFVASPQRGEMFIAPCFTHGLAELRGEFVKRNRFWLPPAKVPLPGFAPNGARSLGVRS